MKPMTPARAPESPPLHESFSLYLLRVAAARAGVLAAGLKATVEASSHLGKFDAILDRRIFDDAKARVSGALALGGPQACAAIRAPQRGDRGRLGIDPYSPGALGASEALAEALLLRGREGLGQFCEAAKQARSGVVLGVMALALRRAWVIAGVAPGEFAPQTQRLTDPDKDERLRAMGASERLDILRGAVSVFPVWAQAVERLKPGPVDPVSVLRCDLFQIDECEPEPLLEALRGAFAQSPGSVLRRIGAPQAWEKSVDPLHAFARRPCAGAVPAVGSRAGDPHERARGALGLPSAGRERSSQKIQRPLTIAIRISGVI